MTGRQFGVDRGGTFTDIVVRRPDGRLLTHRLLSDNPAPPRSRPRSSGGTHVTDAAVAGVRELLGGSHEPVEAVRMGTTVATDALPEGNGERTLLGVVEVHEPVAADGTVLRAPDPDALTGPLRQAYDDGIRAVAVVCVRPDDVLVIETPGGGGYGRPSPDNHQAGEEIDDLRAF